MNGMAVTFLIKTDVPHSKGGEGDDLYALSEHYFAQRRRVLLFLESDMGNIPDPGEPFSMGFALTEDPQNARWFSCMIEEMQEAAGYGIVSRLIITDPVARKSYVFQPFDLKIGSSNRVGMWLRLIKTLLEQELGISYTTAKGKAKEAPGPLEFRICTGGKGHDLRMSTDYPEIEGGREAITGCSECLWGEKIHPKSSTRIPFPRRAPPSMSYMRQEALMLPEKAGQGYPYVSWGDEAVEEEEEDYKVLMPIAPPPRPPRGQTQYPPMRPIYPPSGPRKGSPWAKPSKEKKKKKNPVEDLVDSATRNW